MDTSDETPRAGTPRFAEALNQPIPPSPRRDWADEVLGVPPGEAELIREVRQAVGDQVDRITQRVEESRRIADTVLQYLLRASRREHRADGDAP